jgi:GTP-binding protein
VATLEAASGLPVMPLSGATGEGVQEVLRALRRVIDADRRATRAAGEARTAWQP